MDDVLSQTNEAVMECEYLEEAQWEITNEMRSRANAQAGVGHNDTYGTKMTLDDFYCG